VTPSLRKRSAQLVSNLPEGESQNRQRFRPFFEVGGRGGGRSGGRCTSRAAAAVNSALGAAAAEAALPAEAEAAVMRAAGAATHQMVQVQGVHKTCKANAALMCQVCCWFT